MLLTWPLGLRVDRAVAVGIVACACVLTLRRWKRRYPIDEWSYLMSFDPLMKAIKENPALAEELTNAKTPRERHAILDAHGIEKPNLDSQFPEAGGTRGGTTTTWSGRRNGWGGPD